MLALLLRATGSTFHLSVAFIKDEKQDTYEVILNCLADVYESLSLRFPYTILTDKEEALDQSDRDGFSRYKEYDLYLAYQYVYSQKGPPNPPRVDRKGPERVYYPVKYPVKYLVKHYSALNKDLAGERAYPEGR